MLRSISQETCHDPLHNTFGGRVVVQQRGSLAGLFHCVAQEEGAAKGLPFLLQALENIGPFCGRNPLSEPTIGGIAT